MSLPRRIVLILVWPCLVATGVLAWKGASQLAIAGTFLFPIFAYVFVLNVVDPWLQRRMKENGRVDGGG